MNKNIINYRDFDKKIDHLLEKNNIFFFYGENNYFMSKTIESVCKRLGDVFKEIIYLWDAELDNFLKLFSTTTLFNFRTMLVLRFFNLQEKKSFKKHLIEFLKNYKFKNYLFILYEEKLFLEKERSDEIIKYFLENCVCVEFNNLTKDEIINNFIPQNTYLNLTEEAKELLYESTNGDLWLLSNELEKIKYYFNNKEKVSEENINSCISLYDTADVKELLYAVEEKDLRKALEVLDSLLLEGILPIQIFVAIYRYFRKKFLYKKIDFSKIYRILKELQITDFKLKTSSNSRYAIENCLLSLIKLYSE